MKEKIGLEFCFKGNRTYVQGPDIFDAVLKKMNIRYGKEKITNIKYSAYEMLHSNADVYFLEQFNKNDFSKINSIITFKLDAKKTTVVVVENDDTIECSTEYSEDIVRCNSVINNDTIIFNNSLPDSLTEIIVSMNKYYLQRTVTNKGKWIVTKFEYNNLIDIENIEEKELKLELTNNFNNKLTKSVIKVNNLVVGFIYFSLV